MDENRLLIGDQRSGRESGIGRFLVIVALGEISYALYTAFAKRRALCSGSVKGVMTALRAAQSMADRISVLDGFRQP